MRLGKLRSGMFLIYCFLVGSLRRFGRQLARGPFAGAYELLRFGKRCYRAAWVLSLILRRKNHPEALVRLCQEADAPLEMLYRNADAAYVLVQQVMAKQQYEKAIELMTPLAKSKPQRAKCYGVRGMAHLHLGRYDEALADLTRCHELQPEAAKNYGFNLHRAYLHGLRGDFEKARMAMANHFGIAADERCASELARFLHERLDHLFANLALRGSVGVFISVYPTAVGHAILDPFHYINLFGQRFDNLIMVHSDLNGYTPATRLTMGVLEQYVDTVLCTNADALNFSWQNLGELQHGNFTFLVYNYWSLNRLAFQARQNPAQALHHSRNYLKPPPKLVTRAEALCGRNNVDLSGPLVVVHTREHGYHELRGQRYRNTEVRSYVPALRKLISLGYRVVRIGDAKMTSLRRDVPGLIELPKTDFYCPVLDPYLIARCEFMISCQSGPCSYARVFGKPNLVVNAVYHYTLLPERNDLIAFKDYRDVKKKQSLSVEEIFQRGAHLFDRTEHFVQNNIEVVDMTPEEMEASVCEMLEWLKDPDQPETTAQSAFRQLMGHFRTSAELKSPLATPMTDYIGYVLPECRISDAVAARRPGYLPAAQPCCRPVSRVLARVG